MRGSGQRESGSRRRGPSGRIAPWAGLTLLVLAACGGEPSIQGESSAGERPQQVARSSDGMVVSAMPGATDAGAEMLARGGNAMDAAVAAAFALAVVEPSMSGLGGRTQLLVHRPGEEVVGIDGSVTFPAAFLDALGPGGGGEEGYLSIGTPGTVAALTEAHSRYGSLPLAEVMAPAIRLGEEGFRLSPGEALRLEEAADRMEPFEASRRYFFRADDTPLQAGDLLVQEDLARTLRAIAEGGADVFYRGDIAASIAEDMARNGGFVSAADLGEYRATDTRIMRGTHRGHEILTNGFPSSGPVLIQTLQTLGQLDSLAPPGSPAWGALVARSLSLAVEDRAADLGSMQEKEALLTSREWARERAAALEPRGVSQQDRGGSLATAWAMALPGGTSHLATADADGMVVSMTQSLGPAFGSGVAAPGLGFVYASTLYRTVPPEQRTLGRPVLNQSPALVLRDGRPVYAIGAAGGARILSSLSMVLSRLLDQELSLDQAMAAPRVHPRSDGSLEVEQEEGRAWPTEEVQAFEAMGFAVTPLVNHARIHALHVLPDGSFLGVADPRREGSASGPRRTGTSVPTP